MRLSIVLMGLLSTLAIAAPIPGSISQEMGGLGGLPEGQGLGQQVKDVQGSSSTDKYTSGE